MQLCGFNFRLKIIVKKLCLHPTLSVCFFFRRSMSSRKWSSICCFSRTFVVSTELLNKLYIFLTKQKKKPNWTEYISYKCVLFARKCLFWLRLHVHAWMYRHLIRSTLNWRVLKMRSLRQFHFFTVWEKTF